MADKLVSTHITQGEYACKHCGLLPPGFYGEDGLPDIEYQVLFRAFESIREKRGGRPLEVKSGYRCEDHEREMFEEWVRSGKVGEVQGYLSAHLFGLALDLQAESAGDQLAIVKIARSLRPVPRIGWKQYRSVGSALVHIDFGFLISPLPTAKFAPGVEW